MEITPTEDFTSRLSSSVEPPETVLETDIATEATVAETPEISTFDGPGIDG